jgi:hypothetical protein
MQPNVELIAGQAVPVFQSLGREKDFCNQCNGQRRADRAALSIACRRARLLQHKHQLSKLLAIQLSIACPQESSWQRISTSSAAVKALIFQSPARAIGPGNMFACNGIADVVISIAGPRAKSLYRYRLDNQLYPDVFNRLPARKVIVTSLCLRIPPATTTFNRLLARKVIVTRWPSSKRRSSPNFQSPVRKKACCNSHCGVASPTLPLLSIARPRESMVQHQFMTAGEDVQQAFQSLDREKAYCNIIHQDVDKDTLAFFQSPCREKEHCNLEAVK